MKCIGCDTLRYSTGCNNLCSTKCSGGCDVFNGSCIHGCSDPNALTIDCIGKNITRKTIHENIVIMNNRLMFILILARSIVFDGGGFIQKIKLSKKKKKRREKGFYWRREWDGWGSYTFNTFYFLKKWGG